MAIAEVSVRPVRDGAERAEWDRLMDAHHYLGFRCLFGGGLRHVAETADGRWVALVGWVPGAFKISARDAWIGWAPDQQFRRLHLVANNTRFLILPRAERRQPGVAGAGAVVAPPVGGHGGAPRHPVLLAETFVEPSRFLGTCYLAANWTALGETRGYARAHGGWEAHGVPKRILVRPLVAHACAALRGLDEPASWGRGAALPRRPPRIGCAACTTSCARCPSTVRRAGCGTPWRACSPSPWRPSSRARRARRRSRRSPGSSPSANWRRCARSGARPPGDAQHRQRRPSTASCRNSTLTPWTAPCGAGRRPGGAPAGRSRSMASRGR